MTEDDKDASISGRSVGKAAVGRLRVGQIVTVGQPARASIPSRFETILHPGSHERDGFLRRTPRFNPSETDLPGPGYYQQNKTLVKDPKGEYTSKKGTGSFASSQTRFNMMDRPLFVTPGPGRYDEDGLPPSPSVSTKGTSSFAKPIVNKPDIPYNNLIPGPGYYEPVDNDSKTSKKMSSVFASSTTRFKYHQEPLPGPGQYSNSLLKHRSVTETVVDLQVKNSKGIPNPLDPEHPFPAPPSTSAVFRSTTDREGKTVLKSKVLDPMNLPPVPGSQSKPSTPPTSTPNAAINNSSAKSMPSSIFAPTTIDRFGRPTVKYTLQEQAVPGPGHYENSKHNPKLLISSSWAMSAVGRFDKPATDKFNPPGPAFYSPSPSASKSKFHSNKKSVWC